MEPLLLRCCIIQSDGIVDVKAQLRQRSGGNSNDGLAIEIVEDNSPFRYEVASFSKLRGGTRRLPVDKNMRNIPHDHT